MTIACSDLSVYVDEPAPKVVLSWGLGEDSTAILLRWLEDPTSRDFELNELVVVSAMTGNEWESTRAESRNTCCRGWRPQACGCCRLRALADT